ncbi:MAG TPA: F0F1 ATP synthase subunit A [Bryobacteraceae bacterium]|nr:F0F1 ATP synthase subunit A [Bryobacteraceae bacterium]
MEHEILITRLFNDHLAGPANALLQALGQHAENPARPWTSWITMQILVALIIIILFAVLKSRLSMDNPGKLQHIFELFYNFIRGETENNIGHHAHQYMAFCGCLFIFVLFSNLIGVIPGLESPTMYYYVPAGLAMATFLYYHAMGVRALGIGKYLAHFAGPMPALSPLMIPIEIMSHLARPLSLTIRLYANMFAGEQVTLLFLSLTYFVVPAAFMGLHVFVALLQAYVFSLLTMIYLGGAVAEEH